MKKRAFVRYSKQGKIVPGSLILTGGSHPQGPSTWKEVPADLCCETTTCVEPLVMEVIPLEGFFEFGFRVNNPNTVAGTIEWGDGDSETFDLTANPGYNYFGHNYSTLDYIPHTVKVYFTSVSGFDNLEIGDTDGWNILSISNLKKVFGTSSIDQVDADDNPLLTSLDVSGLPIQSLYALNCSNLAYLNVQGCTSLIDTELYTGAFEVLDFTGCSSLEYADVGDNPNMTTLIIDGCSSLQYLFAADCILTEATVDYIIQTLDDLGVTNGNLYLDGSGNAAPSGASATALANLITKSWVVNTN